MGPGNLTLMASNTYAGGTTVSGGTLQLGNATALGSGGLAANSGVVDLAGNSPTLASLSGLAGAITNSSSSLATLGLNQSIPTTFGGTLRNGQGSLALSLGGSGR